MPRRLCFCLSWLVRLTEGLHNVTIAVDELWRPELGGYLHSLGAFELLLAPADAP